MVVGAGPMGTAMDAQDTQDTQREHDVQGAQRPREDRSRLEVRPLGLHVVDAAVAHRMVPPPLDWLGEESCRAFVDAEPLNLVHVLVGEDQGGTAAGYAAGRQVRDLVADGRYSDVGEVVALHEMRFGAHRQIGLVAGVPVDHITDGLVRPHEQTRAERERSLSAFLDAAAMDLSPVVLTHRPNVDLDALIDELTAGAADVEFSSWGGLDHRVWIVRRPDDIDRVRAACCAIDQLVVIDGHHRVAAAERRGTADGMLLAEIVPDTQLQMHAIDRRVALDGQQPDAVLAALDRIATVSPIEGDAPDRPDGPHDVLMLLDGRWYRIDVDDPPDDPVAGLPPVLLQERVLGPVLGIDDPRTDPRIEHLPGTWLLADVAAQHADGALRQTAVFVPRAVRVDEVAAVASLGRVLPPKSTYVDPKPGPGVFLHLRDQP